MFNAIRVSKLVNAAAAFGAVLLLGVSSPLKSEVLSENKATVTFDQPVSVPGKVLPPGTYVFKSVSNYELVQVFSANEKQLFATVGVVPEDRPVQAGDADCFVQLTKTRADAPQEVEGFFLPGRTTGFQFIYPASQTRKK